MKISMELPPDALEALADLIASRLPDRDPLTEPHRVTLTRTEAAEALGISVDHLERHVLPDLRIVRSGRLRLIPVSELETWVERNAAKPF